MRSFPARLALTALAIAALPGCKPAKTSAADEVTIVVQGDRRELEMQDRALREREQLLREEQRKLEQRRLAADAEQRRRLDEEIARVRSEQGEVAVKVTALQAQKNEAAARRAATEEKAVKVALSDLSGREAGIAVREARLAEREGEVSRRERLLAERERGAAAREEALAAIAGRGTREVPRATAVEQKHRQLLEELEARGVLVADLPLEEQPLSAEIWRARRQGDFARAADLLGELGNALKHLKVDQRFVEAKMVRLQALRSSSRLSASQRAEVERLLREVTSAYSDGKYELANRGLNRMASILDAAATSG